MRHDKNGEALRLAQMVQASPRAYGERDVRKLCTAVISLIDQLKASSSAIAPHRLLLELRDKIKAIEDAEDLEYDGDEGPHAQTRQNAGIELDDFVMMNGDELVRLLSALSDGSAAK